MFIAVIVQPVGAPQLELPLVSRLETIEMASSSACESVPVEFETAGVGSVVALIAGFLSSALEDASPETSITDHRA